MECNYRRPIVPRRSRRARRRLSSYLFSAKGQRWILAVRMRVSVFFSLCGAPRFLLFLLPVTTCCSPRWRTDKLSAAVAGTAILSYPFSFYRIIYHQRSRSLLHSVKRPGAIALGRPVSLFLLLARRDTNFYGLSRSVLSLLLSRVVPFPPSSLIRDGNFITGVERAFPASNRSILLLVYHFSSFTNANR